MSEEELNKRTQMEWRELGFFYDYIENSKKWIIIGSKTGLSNLCQLLAAYASNPQTNHVSEHDHYGPYMYLKITTWTEPIITEDGIMGTISDLRSLSILISRKINESKVNGSFNIDKEYSLINKAGLYFEIREDGFDPASCDNLV